MSTIYDPIKITKLDIFGTEDLSSVDDYNQLIRTSDAKLVAYDMDMQIYLEIGGGRFAYHRYSRPLRHSLILT